MSEENFTKASRLKLRFQSPNGLASVEDLWDLPLQTLDVIHKSLSRRLREVTQEDDSLLGDTASKKDTVELQLRIDILRYIAGVRIAERDKAKAAQDRRKRNQRIMGLLQTKEDQKLEAMSAEELKALLEADEADEG